MTIGSLFSGIGGMDLGLERAGFTVRWQVENEPYCLKVLAKHWPGVTRYGDIRTIDWSGVESVDLVCGGFPCQDLSVAGKRAGIDGPRSGLWTEFVRCLRALRPRYVLVENVPGLLDNAAMGRVLGDLADSGYDAEWQVLSAAAFGAPHLRKRVWIVAYPQRRGCRAGREGRELERVFGAGTHDTGETTQSSHVADTDKTRLQGRFILSECTSEQFVRTSSLADSIKQQRHRWGDGVGWWEREPEETLRAHGGNRRQEDGLSIPESLLGRVAYGIPHRVDRLRGLGNAVVPQIIEWIGRRIMEARA